MDIRKPIFIFGTGRSGTTIFHRIFSEHPEVAWLSSRLCNRFPHKPHMNRWLMQAIDLGVGERFLRRRFLTGEGYDLWEHYCTGFSEPCRDLVDTDVTNRTRRAIPLALQQIMTSKRHRLLLKITGWPRVLFLREIFPDAKFVHVQRDPRAIVNSMLEIDWWSGWRGPDNWRWGALTEKQREDWLRFDKSFVALAAIEMQILHAAMERVRAEVSPVQLLEVSYEDLCDAPYDVFHQTMEFCELPWLQVFESRIAQYSVTNTNYKWREDLTAHQQAILDYFFPDGDLSLADQPHEGGLVFEGI